MEAGSGRAVAAFPGGANPKTCVSQFPLHPGIENIYQLNHTGRYARWSYPRRHLRGYAPEVWFSHPWWLSDAKPALVEELKKRRAKNGSQEESSEEESGPEESGEEAREEESREEEIVLLFFVTGGLRRRQFAGCTSQAG